MAEIIATKEGHAIVVQGKQYALIPSLEGAADTFEKIEDGAWRWHRHTQKATDRMRMELILLGEPTFTMVPAISYNGNGWGSTPEYIGDRAEDGTPWSFASHRATIPSCTYSENDAVSIALMAEANSNSACSLYLADEGEKHVLIFPEEEQPKTLHRHFWGEGFQGTMEPANDFVGIILAVPSDGSRYRYKSLLDFAWRYYGHALKAPRTAAELYKLSIAYARYLLQKERDGFVGVTSGAQWRPSLNGYQKLEHGYQLGSIGQNGTFGAAFLYDYVANKDRSNLDIGIAIYDSFLRYFNTKKGFIPSSIHYPIKKQDEEIDPWDLGEATLEGVLSKAKNAKNRSVYDAYNVASGAQGYFEAYDLLSSVGIDKPEYQKAALDTCDFALELQGEDGELAQSWDQDGNIVSKKGTVGCFLILPMLNAYRRTNKGKYLDCAVRAFDFYYDELERQGFTTAGAPDTYSIDKESASPLLRIALELHELTGDAKYVARAERIAWYYCTWMMHFTVNYPDGCVIKELDYDTFGATSVSTPHQALDQFALREVDSFLKLYELTGFAQWKERALAFWCNACQGVSDGTLFVNGRLRPAGSQDEAVCHTYWRRNSTPAFCPTQWLAAWPSAFRLEVLRRQKDWSFLDGGLTHIEGKIK